MKRPAAAATPAASRATKKKPAAAAQVLDQASRAPCVRPNEPVEPSEWEKENEKSSGKAIAASKCLLVSKTANQLELRMLVARKPSLRRLELNAGDFDNPPVLDVTDALLDLTSLVELEVAYWPIRTAKFTAARFPVLADLCLKWLFEEGNEAEFKLELPELTSLVLESPGFDITSAALKASTKACPKLDYLCLYKVYGLRSLSLPLPSARCVWLHRLEDLKTVSLYAPRIENLRLEACYDLRDVLLPTRFPGFSTFEPVSRSVILDLTNSGIPRRAIDELREDPRFRKIVLPDDEDESHSEA